MASAIIKTVTETQWSSTDTSKHFTVENPATGQVLTTVAAGDAKTAEAAIAASHEAFQSWRWVPLMQRGAYLMKCADALDGHREELAQLLCMENGKPYQDALVFDLNYLIGVFRYFGALVDKLPAEFYDRGAMYITVLYEPHGSCCGIIPSNWPAIHCGGKIAPAIAAGNTMIIKPGEQAPLTAIRIVEIIQSVLPPNVVMSVPGAGAEVAQALVSSPLTKAVSFTGSTASGIAVARTAAVRVKPLVLELGSKNAMIVFEDADVGRAAPDALEGAFFNKGEACTASSRLLVHESVHDAFVERLSSGVKRLVSGDGFDQETHIGPCVTAAAQQRVLQSIEKALDEGAILAARGREPTDPKCKNGFFVPPTVLANVTPDMSAAREEIFGPVTVVIKFKTEEEAISIANDTDFGLLAVIYSRDTERCMRVSRKLDVGMVWINHFNRGAMGMPFGGVNSTGYGRENCIATLKEWSRAKAINQPSGLAPVPVGRLQRACFDY